MPILQANLAGGLRAAIAPAIVAIAMATATSSAATKLSLAAPVVVMLTGCRVGREDLAHRVLLLEPGDL